MTAFPLSLLLAAPAVLEEALPRESIAPRRSTTQALKRRRERGGCGRRWGGEDDRGWPFIGGQRARRELAAIGGRKEPLHSEGIGWPRKKLMADSIALDAQKSGSQVWLRKRIARNQGGEEILKHAPAGLPLESKRSW